jgi:hypothetical protein
MRSCLEVVYDLSFTNYKLATRVNFVCLKLVATSQGGDGVAYK